MKLKKIMACGLLLIPFFLNKTAITMNKSDREYFEIFEEDKKLHTFPSQQEVSNTINNTVGSHFNETTRLCGRIAEKRISALGITIFVLCTYEDYKNYLEKNENSQHKIMKIMNGLKTLQKDLIKALIKCAK